MTLLSAERSPALPSPHFGRLGAIECETRFAVVDVETTGLEPTTNRVIEIAVVELDTKGAVLSEFSSLVDIPGQGEPGAAFVHGISRRMLGGAPRFRHLLGEIADRLAGRIVVGHYVAFDLAHLRLEFDRAGLHLPVLDGATLCTRDLAGQLLPPGTRALGSCCASAGIDFLDPHTALGDARATAALLHRLLEVGIDVPLTDLQRAANEIEWPAVQLGAVRAGLKRRVA